MNDIVISVSKLSKQYKIGSSKPRYNTLRDRIVESIRAPFRRAAGLISGDNYAATEMTETIWALQDVSFEVQRGEVIGIIGNNGAGKSTLLKILSRITEPTTGQALIKGRIGSLLEVGTGFHPELTGRENVYLNGSILGMRRVEIDQKFDAIVEFSGIKKFIDTPVKLYSSGMQVRLAFSVAAHLEPEILLVDEVLSVGDAAFQKKCLGKMKDVTRQGRTVLYVSHNMTSVISLCDRVILIDQGIITLRGEPSDIVQQYLGMNKEVISSRVDLKTHPGRIKDSKPIFQEVRLRDEIGNEADVFRIGDSVVIDVILDTGEIEITSPYIQINVTDSNRLSICKFRSYTMGSEFPSLQGEYKVRFLWENCNLSPGIYSLNLRIRDMKINLDRIIEAIAFQVQPSDYYGTGRIDPNPGIFITNGDWNLTSISS